MGDDVTLGFHDGEVAWERRPPSRGKPPRKNLNSEAAVSEVQAWIPIVRLRDALFEALG